MTRSVSVVESVLQISTADFGGGAERIAWFLFQHLREKGLHAKMVVGRKRSEDRDVEEIDHPGGSRGWGRLWWNVYVRTRPSDHHALGYFVNQGARVLAHPPTILDAFSGVEQFGYPGAWTLFDEQQLPQIIHCHNLHPDYFDLRSLPLLSRHRPVVVTLHDSWLFSGHCAQPLGCGRWRTGCGACPDLSIYPQIRRDATAQNWARKRSIFAESRLFVAAPCQWMLDRMTDSILNPAVVDARVIPHGVNLAVFKQADRGAMRSALGLPQDALILLFVANFAKSNPFKDYDTLKSAISMLAQQEHPQQIIFLTLGSSGPDEQLKNTLIKNVPFQHDPSIIASYYQAADLYLHAAKDEAETFPTVVLEALACGTPVVATAVGGIPEQIQGLDHPASPPGALSVRPAGHATGILVPPRDAEAIAAAVNTLFQNPALRQRLGDAAADDACIRFDENRLVTDYLAWYDVAFQHWHQMRHNSI